MKIIVDKAIPFMQGILEPWADVHYIAGKEISREDVADADALIIRTRTRCNAELLEGSRVKMIATATIGFDHIDLDYCRERGIEVATAAGCNARGVLQWIAGVLMTLSLVQGWKPRQRTLGIVGVGHVGSLVKEYAEEWGFRVICCDPPREEREHCGFLPLEEVASQADILTFHVPLDATTRHMVNAELLELLQPEAVLINASRGEVVDTEAMNEDTHDCVFDVWEHEPAIDRELLERALITTSHIAGYSEQGKANAASMAVQAVARHFGLPLEDWYPAEAARQTPRPISWDELRETIFEYFDVAGETERLKEHPEQFEELRDKYAYRKEYF